MVEAAHAAGARSAGYVVLRLPHELRGRFADWPQRHVPARDATRFRPPRDDDPQLALF